MELPVRHLLRHLLRRVLRHLLRRAFACAGLAACALPMAFAQPQPPIVLVHHARGLRVDDAARLLRFDALAFQRGGDVIAIGTRAAVQRAVDAQTRHMRCAAGCVESVDLAGRVLMPGLHDAHGHLVSLGMARQALDLRATASLAQAQQAIRTHLAAQPPGARWLGGGGWNQANWALGRFPTAAELDEATGDVPTVLDRIDGHAVWANSAALKAAGIDQDTPDPPGGRIERDAQGRPSGVLVDRASDLVDRLQPETTAAELERALDAAIAELLSLGITMVHDAGISPTVDRLLRARDASGRLPLRVWGMGRGGDQAFFAALMQRGPDAPGKGHYALAAIKLFADGTLGSRGAALLAPYADQPEHRGLLLIERAALQAQLHEAVARGFQVNVHAIGDAANRLTLDAFEQAAHALGARSTALRHRIEHAQVVALDDLPRWARAGVIASVQPTHATSDMNMAERRVGAQRIRGAYAWQRLRHAGARLACGSDFPIEQPNPWEGLYAAVTRTDAQGRPPGGWYGTQRLTLAQALHCFTRGAAYAAHQEASVGGLDAGQRADFIVVDRDPTAVPPKAWRATQVLQTWVGGQQVFARRAAAAR